MRIKDINTRDKFYEFGDVWYQRAHKLREASENTDKPLEYRKKASKLFNVMFLRVMQLHQYAIKINQVTPKVR